MTEIARFYGIIIRMYPEGGMYHHLPHFHAYYQGMAISFQIDRLIPLDGELPKRQQRLVEAWAELHQQELTENWQRLISGDAPRKIKPLR
jgi:hypothetical protein